MSGPGGAVGVGRRRRFRTVYERGVLAGLFGCAAVTVITTGAIVALLAAESARFFGDERVGVIEFLTGTTWNPSAPGDGRFGVLPLVTGTLLVAVISSCVALPGGLLTAVFLSEYAPGRVRALLKPVLEILAGIPTVVYGFFALTVITPAFQAFIPGLGVYNALAAGVAVGIMCLPIVTSLSEDALRAVPRSLREGAYAAGATKFDVVVKVVIPAALSGVIAAFLLAIARAVGETMIVTLAAGAARNFTLDPTESVQTMTAYIVSTTKGETPYGSIERRAVYAVGALLFVMTLAMTVAGHRVLKRFREV